MWDTARMCTASFSGGGIPFHFTSRKLTYEILRLHLRMTGEGFETGNQSRFAYAFFKFYEGTPTPCSFQWIAIRLGFQRFGKNYYCIINILKSNNVRDAQFGNTSYWYFVLHSAAELAWAVLDLNQRPSVCETDALTSWANRPWKGVTHPFIQKVWTEQYFLDAFHPPVPCLNLYRLSVCTRYQS